MAWQSGYGGSVSFDPAVYWTNTLMAVTEWRARYGYRMHEIPYINSTYFAPPLINGLFQWRAVVTFLVPIEFSGDTAMRVEGSGQEYDVQLRVNVNDFWSGKCYIQHLDTICPLDGPSVAVATLRGINVVNLFTAA